MAVTALFRLTPTTKHSTRSDSILYGGTLEEKVEGSWVTATVDVPSLLFQWMIAGSADVPESVANAVTAVRAAASPQWAVPSIVRLNATGVTTLSVGPANVVALVDSTGTSVEINGLVSDLSETVIDLTAYSGRMTIFLDTLQYTRFVIDAASVISITDDHRIYGVRDATTNDVLDVSNVQYKDGLTYISVTASHIGTKDILHAPVVLGAVPISEGDPLLDYSTEWPCLILDQMFNVLANLPTVRAGETQISTAGASPLAPILVVPAWCYTEIQESIQEGGGAPARQIHTDPRALHPHLDAVNWTDIVGRPGYSVAVIEEVIDAYISGNVSSSRPYVEKFILTENQAFIQKVTLTYPVVIADVMSLIIPNGPVTIQDEDWEYDADNNQVVWQLKGLNSALNEGDIIYVHYYRTISEEE